MHFITLTYTLIKTQIKILLHYRLDFFLGVAGSLIQQVISLVFLISIFSFFDSLAGLNLYEALFIYACFEIVRAIDQVYNDGIWAVAWVKVRDGSFSNYLIRPLSPLYQIITEKFKLESITSLLVGLVLLKIALNNIAHELSWQECIYLVFFIVNALIIFFSIKLIAASLAFWLTASGEVMTLVYEFSQFAKYPVGIYTKNIAKFLVLFIFPFSLGISAPFVFLFGESIQFLQWEFGGWSLVILNSVVTIVFFAISLFTWTRGIKRYEPTGT
jgi:ABC-2 type transport system permease protein